MDSRRPPYQGHPPQAPPPPPPPHHDPRQQQQTPSTHHYAPQPPPPPPPSYHPQHHSGPPPPHAQAQGPPPQHQQQQHHPAPYQPGPPAPGPALPPIQPAYGQQPSSASTSDQPTLPSFRQPSAPPQHDTRDGAPPPEHYHPYNHNRSGHATPAPVNRSYSHDSGHQRSPATPAGPGPGSFPPSQAQDGAQQPPGQQPHHMDHGHHGYPPTNGHLPHGLPPPGPQHHHESHPQQQMTPMMDNHYQPYGPPPPNQQPMGYAPYNSGPVSSMYGQKRKQMRATQVCLESSQVCGKLR